MGKKNKKKNKSSGGYGGYIARYMKGEKGYRDPRGRTRPNPPEQKVVKKTVNKSSSSSSRSDNDRGRGTYRSISTALNNDRQRANSIRESLRASSPSSSRSSSSRSSSSSMATDYQALLAQQQAASARSLADMRAGFEAQISQFRTEAAASQRRFDQFKLQSQRDAAAARQASRQQLKQFRLQSRQEAEAARAQFDQFRLQSQREAEVARAQFEQTQAALTQQIGSANAAREVAEQRASNMLNAFVPQANPTVETVAYGDERTDPSRKRRNNQLSDLSILSGLGPAANPLAGLQLA